jgi:hypothetical protein
MDRDMLSLIPAILQMVLPVISKVLPDPQQQAQVQAQLTQELLAADAAHYDTLKSVIVAETQAGGLNALWRPLLALFYMGLMGWSWVLCPIINAAFHCTIWTPDASTIGTVGGLFTTVYGLGRSLEKGVSVNAGR